MSAAPWPYAVPAPDDALAALHRDLRELNATVAVAESLTGGLVCAELTRTPGASDTIRGGLVVYATDLKVALAGVPEALLAARGPVDRDVALALAHGVRVRLAATYGIGVTGVAGPDAQGDRPVGTVFLAVVGPDGETVAERHIDGDRSRIRQAAVDVAVELLSRECREAITTLRSL
jgi:nicotinamide-nucleotide amidase